MFRASNFERSLENATSHLRLEPDWQSIMVICDAIRQGDVNAKYAIAAVKKKMYSPNPHTAMFALLVLESVVKNCGTPIHDEISNKANCEMFANLVNTVQHEDVKAKMLELIQAWAYAFRSTYKYRSIKDTMNILKTEGHKFPELKEADAMFASDIAPDWQDGDTCHRCRVAFSFTQRKHHCRNCGQVFCQQCSAKQSTLPRFGIEKEVRVCDGCYTQLQKPTLSRKSTEENDLPAEYLGSSLAQQNQAPARKSDQELQEEEELQLALALSQSEAESNKKPATGISTITHTYQPKSPTIEPVSIPKTQSPVDEIPSDPELARYLNRNYWEQRKVNEPASPSAPSPMPSPMPQASPQLSILSNSMKICPDDAEINDFSGMMKSQVEIFVNRMKSNSSRGRSISCDTSVQTLFMNLTTLHSRLLTYIKEMDDKRMWYEQLQDKLVQIKDSRAALDVLRQEHQDKLRKQAEEAERQRQLQMAQKLEIMRKKKQEYLQYQRQLALQRIQEQEREMQMRQEQQKAQYRMGAMTYPYMPQVQQPPNQGSPIHGMNFPQYAYNPSMNRFPPNTTAIPGQQNMPLYGNQFMGVAMPGMNPSNVPISENIPNNPQSNSMMPQGMSVMPGQMQQPGQPPMQQPGQPPMQQPGQPPMQQPGAPPMIMQQQHHQPPATESAHQSQQQQMQPQQNQPQQQQPPVTQMQPVVVPAPVVSAPPPNPEPVLKNEPETAELISFD